MPLRQSKSKSMVIGLNPYGAIIHAFHLPTKKRGKPTSTMVLRVEGRQLLPSTIDLIKWHYDNKSHRVLGVWRTPTATEIVLSYEGTKGRGPDQRQITKRLEDQVLPFLPYNLQYSLHYWNDPERPTS